MVDPIQRRTVALLSAAQMFTSVGTAAVVTTGPMLAAALAGEAWSGSVSTAQSVGAAVASALLARFAALSGRRPPLATGIAISLLGALLVMIGAVTGVFWLVLLGCSGAGFGIAANLQARFAATDLAEPLHRGRDLSTVVWLGTVGVVAGPNLIGAGDAAATALGLPALTGLFILAAACLLVALLLVAVGLRPDPLLLARERSGAAASLGRRPGVIEGLRVIWSRPRARAGLAGVVIGHGLMVGVMGMTPVHMTSHGAVIEIVGFVISLHMFAMYGLSPIWGLLADRIGGPAVVVLGLVLLIASGVVAAVSGTNDVVIATALVLLGIGWGASTVAGAVLIVDGVEASERVAAQGASDMMMNASGAVFGLLAGFALSGFGYAGLGVAAAVVSVVAAAFVLANARTRQAAPLSEP